MTPNKDILGEIIEELMKELDDLHTFLIPWEKRKDYEELLKSKVQRVMQKYAKSVIEEQGAICNMEHRPPMGVSQWAEYGKKYKYWDYFEEKCRQDTLNNIDGKM